MCCCVAATATTTSTRFETQLLRVSAHPRCRAPRMATTRHAAVVMTATTTPKTTTRVSFVPKSSHSDLSCRVSCADICRACAQLQPACVTQSSSTQQTHIHRHLTHSHTCAENHGARSSRSFSPPVHGEGRRAFVCEGECAERVYGELCGTGTVVPV